MILSSVSMNYIEQETWLHHFVVSITSKNVKNNATRHDHRYVFHYKNHIHSLRTHYMRITFEKCLPLDIFRVSVNCTSNHGKVSCQWIGSSFLLGTRSKCSRNSVILHFQRSATITITVCHQILFWASSVQITAYPFGYYLPFWCCFTCQGFGLFL
jgi:hypothetical protein